MNLMTFPPALNFQFSAIIGQANQSSMLFTLGAEYHAKNTPSSNQTNRSISSSADTQIW